MMLYRGLFAIVDHRSIQSNITAIRSLLRPATQLLVSVKANGYGHGATEVAHSVLAAGADWLGVASLEEGVQLREAGIAAPILVFGAAPPDAAPLAARLGISLTVSSHWDSVLAAVADDPSPHALARALRLDDADPPLRLHLKLDTGMGRIGFRDEDQVLRWAQCLAQSRGIMAEGLFTHFARADDPAAQAIQAPITRLRKVEARLADAGIRPVLVHAANSAATLRGDSYHFDLVRVGISTYGYRPSVTFASPVPLLPALNLYAFLTRLAWMEEGEEIGYGGTFVAERRTLVGTVPVGYGDGYPRWLSNRGSVVIHGQHAPVIGRVCMDQLMVDVTDIATAAVGDCVCIFGRHAPETWTMDVLWSGKRGSSSHQQAEWLAASFASETTPDALHSLDSLAGIGDTISYELMCALAARVPRIHVGTRP